MMHSPAMIATTEPKPAADKAASFGKAGSHHSKKGLRETEASGNSFSKVLERAGQKISLDKKEDKKGIVSARARSGLEQKGRSKTIIALVKTGPKLNPEKNENHKTIVSGVSEKNLQRNIPDIKQKTENEQRIKSRTLPAAELAAVVITSKEISVVNKKPSSDPAKDTGERNLNVGKTLSLPGRKNEIVSEAPRVVVIDRRQKESAFELRPAGNHALRHDRNSESLKSEPIRFENGESRVSETRFVLAETDIELAPRSETAPGGSRSAAAELARRLDGQAGSDIVKQVRVVMNRADAGDIRINLRPDNLGNVRVRLHLEENRLTGRIFVESAAARDAFRSALDGLQTKLVESGFGAADLELSFDDSGGSFQMNQDKRRNHGNLVEAVRDFESMSVTTKIDSAGDGRVNLMA